MGDLDALLPRWPDLPAEDSAARQPERVLSLALSLLLAPAGGTHS